MYSLCSELPFAGLDDVEFKNTFVIEVMPNDQYATMLFNPFIIYEKRGCRGSPNDLIDPETKYNIMKCPYYSCDTFQKLVSSDPCMGDAKIMYTNIRSVPKNLDELLTDLGASMNEIDFCCFTETRLNSELIQMYNIERCRGNFNCRNRKGGGVAIYTKKEYTVSVMDELSLSQSSFIESLFVKTKISSFNIIVGCVYSPPGAVFDQFMVSISDVLLKLNKYNNHIIVIVEISI